MNSETNSDSEPQPDARSEDAPLEWIRVASIDEIPEGQARAFDVGRRVVAVFRWQDQFHAIDDFCPHMGASLATGHFDSKTMTVACPWHGWRFDVRDGTWCDNRRIKTDAFPIRVVDGEIEVGIQAEDKDKSTWSKED